MPRKLARVKKASSSLSYFHYSTRLLKVRLGNYGGEVTSGPRHRHPRATLLTAKKRDRGELVQAPVDQKYRWQTHRGRGV